MCDTFYLPSDSGVFFGKNSDRNAAEPQALRLVPPRKASNRVRVGPREFDLNDAGHAMAISCPTWMPGAEMGLNGAGVAIGNEAVFSRFKAAPGGILGMDFVRAALASSSTAQEALETLIALTERYDQGGNGAFKGRMVYNNSYLIAGPDGAFVLETAAKRWAWKPAQGPTAVSNSYSILEDYKRLDADTRKSISPVNERMACLDEADAGRLGEKGSWKAYVEDRFLSRFSAGDARRRAVEGLLGAAAMAGGRASALAVLRAHAAIDPERPGRPRNVCDHDRDVMGNPTTASMLVEYRASGAVLWFTGASYACTNVFKPILLSGGEFTPLWNAYDYAEGSAAGEAYWRSRRDSAKRARRNPRIAEDRSSQLTAAQAKVSEVVDGLPEAPSPAQLAAASERIALVLADWDALRI
ncbi:MAG: hypothetical protein KKA67_03620 [Spirochaetes bacterium]|nr:hypothetical protein [Spirochaetota bacterium]MBU1079390.1 hypothetical protein [Spirochaetota bacterium]